MRRVAQRVASAGLEARLAGLLPIGRDGHGATTRLPWTPEDAAAGAWFAEQAAELGLKVRRDAAGNRWALPPDDDGPWWTVGSHLDSVPGGGSYDGALGVAAGFAVAAAATVRVAVVAFADEEGARFATPTFGSRAVTGHTTPGTLERVDADGVVLADALRGHGLEPSRLADAANSLRWVRGFLELHLDQSTDAARAGAPFLVALRLAARARVRAVFSGRADHAGTTPMDERRDALAAAAALVGAAETLSRRGELRATVGRLDVEPGALTTIASQATAWVDLRAATDLPLEAALGRLTTAARVAAERRSVTVETELASRSRGTIFDRGLVRALADGRAPVTTCWAGHDAGFMATRVPSAMVLVRNRSGASHTAEEEVDLEDAAAATAALVDVVDRSHGASPAGTSST
jgi:N-carbamoyl-L-amino-acid hydrolase